MKRAKLCLVARLFCVGLSSLAIRADEHALIQNCDVNGDTERDLADAIYLINWRFRGGSEPVPVGADHVCTYGELLVAQHAGELSELPEGTTFWLHRVRETVVVNGRESPPGAGGRCNDWRYVTAHISDGEYGAVVQGEIVYHFDQNTKLGQDETDGAAGDGPFDGGGCDQTTVFRAITCCHQIDP